VFAPRSCSGSMGASGSAEVAVRFGAARASAVHIAEVIAEVMRDLETTKNIFRSHAQRVLGTKKRVSARVKSSLVK